MFRDPRRSVDRHQCPSAGDPAEHQAHSRRRRPEDAGPTCWTRNGRARSPSPTRRIPAPPIPTSPCWRSSGATTTRPGTRSRNCSPTPRCSIARRLVFQGVGNGEFPLGMSLEYAGYQWSSNGAPVKVIYPQDGTIAQMEGVAIIKGGPNAENAKAVRRLRLAQGRAGEDPGLCVPPRRARQDLDLAKLPGADAAAHRHQTRRL